MKKKKDILFLGLHRPNRSPSQRYRIEQFLPYLDEVGLQYDYAYLLNEKMDKQFYAKGAFIAKAWIVWVSFFKLLKISLFSSKKYAVVFVQREAFMLGSAMFEGIIAKNAKLIFDFDDSIWLSNVSKANKKWAFLKNPNKTKEIIQVSSEVIVGNAYLAKFAKQYSKNVNIIPTCVDELAYQRKLPLAEKKNGKVCIGWSGSQTTIEHFKLALPMLESLYKKYGDKIYFKVIGDPSFEHAKLNIKGIAWQKETEIQELEEFDIGIMPLPRDEWSKGKCGLKALVYQSMEIPAVIENFGANQEIIQSGETGFLANDEKDWLEKLSLLIDSYPLRSSMGKKGQHAFLDNYSISSQKDSLLQILLKHV